MNVSEVFCSADVSQPARKPLIQNKLFRRRGFIHLTNFYWPTSAPLFCVLTHILITDPTRFGVPPAPSSGSPVQQKWCTSWPIKSDTNMMHGMCSVKIHTSLSQAYPIYNVYTLPQSRQCYNHHTDHRYELLSTPKLFLYTNDKEEPRNGTLPCMSHTLALVPR
jgi:hypothetical protein